MKTLVLSMFAIALLLGGLPLVAPMSHGSSAKPSEESVTMPFYPPEGADVQILEAPSLCHLALYTALLQARVTIPPAIVALLDRQEGDTEIPQALFDLRTALMTMEDILERCKP